MFIASRKMLAKKKKKTLESFFIIIIFGLCLCVGPGAPDQEPNSHQCRTPAETLQALILATVINSNAL